MENDDIFLGSPVPYKGYQDEVYDQYGKNENNFHIAENVLKHGLHVVAASGGGKSMLLGRYIARSLLFSGTPQIIIDNGSTIDNLLFEVLQTEEQNPNVFAWLLSRIRIVDVSSANGLVSPLPFFHQFGNESASDIASRFVDLIRRINPQLEEAQVYGLPPLEEAAMLAGVELVKRGWQITEMEQVLSTMNLVDETPKSLRVRLLPFTLSESQRAFYGAAKPAIDWKQVMDRGETVIFDFRTPMSTSALTLALHWIFFWLTEFIEYRGEGASPINIIIDELFEFTSANPKVASAFVTQLTRLLQVRMRRYNTGFIIAHQEMNQFMGYPALQKLLLGMKSQIVGQVVDPEDALLLAHRLFFADPDKVKREEIRWDAYSEEVWTSALRSYTERYAYPLDTHIVDEPMGEQYAKWAQFLMQQKPLHFVMLKLKKGGNDGYYANPGRDPLGLQRLLPFNIYWIEQDKHARFQAMRSYINAYREALIKRDARPIAEVLEEIAARTSSSANSQQSKQSKTIPTSFEGTLE